MSEMIDRVEKAMLAALEDDNLYIGSVATQAAARAVIEAMREPTREMRRAGFEASPHDVGGCRDQIQSDKEWMKEAVLSPYTAMIDAALK